MAESPLLLTRNGSIARATLNRPDKRNAFDDALVAAIDGALEAVTADNSLRALVVTGAGDHFSAGADLGWMRRMADQDEASNRADARAFAAMLAKLDRMPIPSVALVRGAVYGGGVGLVAACDIAVCAPDARFCLSEVRLGLVPAVIGPYVQRAVGERWMRRLMLTAEVAPAELAQSVGLVHEVAPDPDRRVAELLEQLVAGAPQAQAEAKASARRCAGTPPDDALIAYTADLIARLRGSAEGREGIDAFLAKRPPPWQRDPGP